MLLKMGKNSAKQKNLVDRKKSKSNKIFHEAEATRSLMNKIPKASDHLGHMMIGEKPENLISTGKLSGKRSVGPA